MRKRQFTHWQFFYVLFWEEEKSNQSLGRNSTRSVICPNYIESGLIRILSSLWLSVLLSLLSDMCLCQELCVYILVDTTVNMKTERIKQISIIKDFQSQCVCGWLVLLVRCVSIPTGGPCVCVCVWVCVCVLERNALGLPHKRICMPLPTTNSFSSPPPSNVCTHLLLTKHKIFNVWKIVHDNCFSHLFHHSLSDLAVIPFFFLGQVKASCGCYLYTLTRPQTKRWFWHYLGW